MCHAKKNWTEILPTVLPGLCTCFKEDLKASPAEMLYGSTLRIPGEFFIQEDLPSDPEIFIEKHRIHMRDIKLLHITIRRHLSFIKIYMIALTFKFAMILLGNLSSLLILDLFVLLIELMIICSLLILQENVITTERLKPAFLPRETDFVVPPHPSSKIPATPSTPSLCKNLKTYSGPGLKKVKFAT